MEHDEFFFDDGGQISVASTPAGVTVYQGAAGTQGRGATLLTPDQAEQLAAALSRHASQARGDAPESAEEPAAAAEEPAAAQ